MHKQQAVTAATLQLSRMNYSSMLKKGACKQLDMEPKPSSSRLHSFLSITFHPPSRTSHASECSKTFQKHLLANCKRFCCHTSAKKGQDVNLCTFETLFGDRTQKEKIPTYTHQVCLHFYKTGIKWESAMFIVPN